MVFTEVSVELQLSKVGKKLNPSALHHVLTEVHHAVEVVEMSRLGVFVAFSVHCDHKRTTRNYLKREYYKSPSILRHI